MWQLGSLIRGEGLGWLRLCFVHYQIPSLGFCIAVLVSFKVFIKEHFSSYKFTTEKFCI